MAVRKFGMLFISLSESVSEGLSAISMTSGAGLGGWGREEVLFLFALRALFL